eukprot:236192_1
MKIKVEFNKEVTKYSFQSLDNLRYADLISFVSGAYGLKDFTLKYIDEDEENINIFSDNTLRDAFEEMNNLRVFVCKSVSGSNANATTNNHHTLKQKPPPKNNVAAPNVVTFYELQRNRRMKLEAIVLEKLNKRRAMHDVPSFLNCKSKSVFKIQKKGTKSTQIQTSEFNKTLIHVDSQGDMDKKHWSPPAIEREVKFRLETIDQTLNEVSELADKQTKDNIQSINTTKKKQKINKNKCAIVDTVCKNVKINVENGEKILLKLTQLEATVNGRLINVLKIRKPDGSAVTYKKKKAAFFTQGTTTVIKDQKVLEWYEDLLKRLKTMKLEQQKLINECKTANQNEWKVINKRANKKLEYNERKRVKQNERNEQNRNKKRKISEIDDECVHDAIDILDSPRPLKRVRVSDKTEQSD